MDLITPWRQSTSSTFWILVKIPAASCGAFKSRFPTAPIEHFLSPSDTVYTDEWSQLLLGLLRSEQNIRLPRIPHPTASAVPRETGQIALLQRCFSWSALPAPANIAAAPREIYAHDLPLLPLCRFPYHKLPPLFEVFLPRSLLPPRSKDLFGTSASIQSDISGHRPHAHSLLVPCLYSISPSGCPLSSPQQAVGYSAWFFINQKSQKNLH